MSMTPELTVVIPTYDRREPLRACLESLCRQYGSADRFEVVVAVDGSDDGTEVMLGEFQSPFPLSIVTQRRAGASAARNAGARNANGRILLFVDDDVIASPSTVGAHIAAHQKAARIVGVGPIQMRLPPRADRFARLRADEWQSHCEHLKVRPLSYRDCYGGNFSVPRTTFEEVGGFAEDLPVENDFELAYRLHAIGIQFVFVPEAVVTEEGGDDWREIFADLQRRGMVALELARRHPAMLPQMELGGLEEWSRPWVALRRLLLALRLPPLTLARLGFLAPGRAWAQRWYRFVYSYSYWSGVRRVAIDA